MDKKSNKNRDYSEYDAMTTAELNEILYRDANKKSEDESDGELILHILEIVTEREKDNIEWDTDSAWKDFKEHYLPYVNDDSVLPVKKKGLIRTAKTGRANRLKGKRSWKAYAQAAAAMLVIMLIVGSATAYARGNDFWSRAARWAGGVFRFEYTGTVPETNEEENATDYATLPKVLELDGISEKLVPTWIPEEYSEVSVEVVRNEVQTVYSASYASDDQMMMMITVTELKRPEFGQMEIDEGGVIEYEKNGIIHYILTNMGACNATWGVGPYQCAIYSCLEANDLKKMIDSIYEE